MSYYEFKDGKMMFVSPEVKPRVAGTYSKTNGRWELKLSGSNVYILRCTFFNMTMASPDGTWAMTNSRYFWFSDYLGSLRGK